jgi:hypothetical protein
MRTRRDGGLTTSDFLLVDTVVVLKELLMGCAENLRSVSVTQ